MKIGGRARFAAVALRLLLLCIYIHVIDTIHACVGKTHALRNCLVLEIIHETTMSCSHYKIVPLLILILIYFLLYVF